MKKYIIDAGYTFKNSYNDMTNKQFFMSDVNYENSNSSTLGNIVLDRQETYILFIKDFDPSVFKSKLEGIINDANSEGVCAVLGNAIQAERQEQGHLITMSFIIQGG